MSGGSARPKRRSDWDSGCYREGGSCWVHKEYPFLWAVGLAMALAVIVGPGTLYAKYGDRGEPAAEDPAESAPAVT
ncbi:hypothetical protein [Streptomyces sp.]|uniref:hypothetical protein n=1 Tax=Streptomyces sp. TaxID=1931 RepID=UPI002810D01B|nr:hypothetical protein [Streptomyces sp.]